MSKTIAIRVSDEVHSALAAQCLATGQTMTELLNPHILGLIDLPPAPADPLEARVMELETLTELQQTQLTQHKSVLDGVACELVALYARLDIIDTSANHLEHCFDQATPDPQPEAIDLKATEKPSDPEQIGVKRSPVSSRDSGEGCTSTSGTVDPDIQQAIIAALRPYADGGYYFRSEYLGQTKILHTYRQQAIQMGFSSQATKIAGERVRVWLNREYCLQAANTQQTT